MQGSPVSRTVDVAILGGGIIGLTCAEEIRRRGGTVAVLDPRPAGEASWAAGGMLAVDYEFNAPSPLAGFARYARSLWPALADRLGVPLTRGGTLCPAHGGEELERLWSRWSW